MTLVLFLDLLMKVSATRAWVCTQVVECSPGLQKALDAVEGAVSVVSRVTSSRSSWYGWKLPSSTYVNTQCLVQIQHSFVEADPIHSSLQGMVAE